MKSSCSDPELVLQPSGSHDKEKIKIENGRIFLPTIGVLVATGQCHPFYHVPVYMYRQDGEDGLGSYGIDVGLSL